MRQSLISNFRKVCEATAINASAWNGRADKYSANASAMAAVRRGLGAMSMSGHVVLAQRERINDALLSDPSELLRRGEVLGRGGDSLDIAVDPIEGTNLCANNQPNAISAIAFAPRETLLNAPVERMHKLACGPAVDPESVGIDRAPAQNVAAVAAALGKPVSELVVCILDRSRHSDLIREVRETGARVRLLYDGDVQACLSCAIEHTNVDMLVGEGGGPEGVLACAGLKALGGFFQGRFHFTAPGERDAAARVCDFDVDAPISMDEIVRTNDVHFVATGITDGDMLGGVHRSHDGSVTTHSLAMSSVEHTTMFVETRYRMGTFGTDVSEPGLHDSIFLRRGVAAWRTLGRDRGTGSRAQRGTPFPWRFPVRRARP